MAITTFCIITLLISIGLLVLSIYLLSLFLSQKKRIQKLVDELGSESLEHYLKSIKEKGFDVTVKPKKK